MRVKQKTNMYNFHSRILSELCHSLYATLFGLGPYDIRQKLVLSHVWSLNFLTHPKLTRGHHWRSPILNKHSLSYCWTAWWLSIIMKSSEALNLLFVLDHLHYTSHFVESSIRARITFYTSQLPVATFYFHYLSQILCCKHKLLILSHLSSLPFFLIGYIFTCGECYSVDKPRAFLTTL